MPPLTRDALIRAYGVDCLFEEGKILLIGSSIDDWPGDSKVSFEPIITSFDKSSKSNGIPGDQDENIKTKKASAPAMGNVEDLKDMPWRKPKGWFSDRLIVKDFKRSKQLSFNNRVIMVYIV